jgi:hypothetical protein
MEIIKWALILAGAAIGTVLAWRIQVPVLALLLLAYAACFSIKLPKLQIAIASLFGGLALGLGLHFLIGLGGKGDYLGMVIAPLIIWLVLRVIFYGVETKYTLHPNAALTQMRYEEENQQSTSGLAGDKTDSATTPDASSKHMRYEYFNSGEIAMGGPTYGEVIFSNGCALSGVGPTIVLSEDGQFAAMSKPSRSAYSLLLADFHEKCVYKPTCENFWDVETIKNGVLYLKPTFVGNAGQQLMIAEIIATTPKIPLVKDGIWWVEDYEGREPFPQYKTISISSAQGTHKVTFVPDLEPFKSNPFLSGQNPEYTMLVDDELLKNNFKTKRSEALWVEGLPHENVCDGRFLVLPTQIIDFKESKKDSFSIKKPIVFPFNKGCDNHTYTDFEYGEKEDLGYARLRARGYVLPRSTDSQDAEYASYSCTSPWDEEKVTYWDASTQKRMQSRKQIKRYFDYTIYLDRISDEKTLKKIVMINLVNRANTKHEANFIYQSETNATNEKGGYSGYQLTTSCGITLENVLHEAIWSHCGRYLAVVYFEQPPLVPHKIAIIDFKMATIKELAGSYALPSFIWFDAKMLDFTHLIGVDERLNFGPNRTDHESLKLRTSDDEHTKNPYALLIDGIEQRRLDAEKRVEKKKSKVGYSGAIVNQISQHCILFAPDFDTPILQPPAGVENT